jgi:polyphenol oxidase
LAIPKAPAQPKLLSDPNLTRVRWLLHGFSTRAAGNLGFTADASRSAVQRNRSSFLSALGASDHTFIGLRQIHSDAVHRIEAAPEDAPVGDGAITNRPGVLLTIQTADCLPILLADKKNNVIGAFHAGWRGTLARIVEKGVGAMRRDFGSAPRDIVAAIGPGIHACCYSVGAEVRDQFESQFSYAAELFEDKFDMDPVRRKYPLMFMNMRAPGHGEPASQLHLDLVKANVRQLRDAGVPARNITASELCTSCRSDLLFSYRKERGQTGRMLAAIAIRE